MKLVEIVRMSFRHPPGPALMSSARLYRTIERVGSHSPLVQPRSPRSVRFSIMATLTRSTSVSALVQSCAVSPACRRIAALRSFDNPALSMAYVDKHVAKMFWSLVSPGQGAKRSNALSRTPSGKHQRFVFVGTVANMYFFLPSGAPPDQVNIRIKPLDDRDRIFANNVLGKYSEPDNTLVTANYADIKLSKWTTYRPEGEEATRARPFTDIHDTRKELLLPVERMPPYRAADLKIDTLVVAEASPNKSDKFSKWTAAYTLNWVAVLDDTTPAPNITAFQEEPEPDIRVEL
ncbi:hypothetical protein EXIGLDRAFT_339721 [Exidia glandulosa HHB12029]|uniref:Uncharacterized protein n=1 Tax=Exidia glandulosa HHB12029 TaxID=1314781 RepID=A0A165CIX6_EXIGL|nr:hypothetical protein EXIGLDRAFT_339721 [Exidia glandulosa HHB12029]